MWPFKRSRAIELRVALEPKTRDFFTAAIGDALKIPRQLVLAAYQDVSEWSKRGTTPNDQVALMESRYLRWADCAARGMEFPVRAEK